MKKENNENLRPAELFGKRLRMSNENIEVMNAMAQMRAKKEKARILDEIETAENKELYYT